MDLLSASVSMYPIHIVPAEASDHMGLELEAAGSCYVDAGNQTCVFCESSQCSSPPSHEFCHEIHILWKPWNEKQKVL